MARSTPEIGVVRQPDPKPDTVGRLPIGPLTALGRAAVEYDRARRLPLVPDGAPSAPALPAAPPPLSKARIRDARQQALLGARLAKSGHFDRAIPTFRRSLELNPAVAAVWHDFALACLGAGQTDEAVEALRQAARLDSTLLPAHLTLGTVLDHMGHEREAVAVFETVLRLDPANHVVRARVAQIQVSHGLREEAASAFRAAAATPGLSVADAQLYMAQAARAAEDSVAAEACLLAAIEDDPNRGAPYVALGQIYAETGKTDLATEHLERGLTLDPRLFPAWYSLAVIKKFTKADQELIDRMVDLAARPAVSPGQRKPLLFALGKVHDDLKDYPTAMRHFDAANAIRAAAGGFNRDLLARQTQHLIAATPPGFLDQRPDVRTDDPTPILIVGMPRSGTTLVEQILSSHPKVAAGGELHFWRDAKHGNIGVFGADANAERAGIVTKEYLDVLRAISPDAARVTDKMPFNFSRLGLIRQLFPRATIVHCRRNPIAICLSIYTTHFENAFDFAADRGDLVCFYREYEKLMAHWHAVLPPDRFIDIQYEALVGDPEPLTRQLIATCGLEWDDACLSPHRNQRQIATASLWQARQPIYRTSVERWRRYEPWLGELRALVPDADPRTNPSV